MSGITFDFADDMNVELKVQEVLNGAKSRTEAQARLQGCVIKPNGEVCSIQGRGDGFDVLFLIGKGKRPRVVHCVDAPGTDFDDFA